MDREPPRRDDPGLRILQILDVLRDWFAGPDFRGCAFVDATVELADTEHPARQVVLGHQRRILEWITQLVAEHGIAESRFVARQLVSLMERAIRTALVEHDPDNVALEFPAPPRLTRPAAHPTPQHDTPCTMTRRSP